MPVASWERLLATLVDERGNALKRYALLLTGDDRAAEDLVQDALVKVLSGRSPAGDPATVEAYVRRVMATLAIDRHRSRGRWLRAMPLLARREEVAEPQTSVAERQHMADLLSQLSARQRACLVLRFYEDLSITQVAAVLGCGEGTVKRHVSEALTRLGAVLRPTRGGQR